MIIMMIIYFNLSNIADEVSKSLIDTIIDARKENTLWKNKTPVVLLINNLGATPGKQVAHHMRFTSHTYTCFKHTNIHTYIHTYKYMNAYMSIN